MFTTFNVTDSKRSALNQLINLRSHFGADVNDLFLSGIDHYGSFVAAFNWLLWMLEVNTSEKYEV